MGCFSWKCRKCGKAINSDSFDGDYVELTVIKNGKPLEQMTGRYDSYGRVFNDETGDSFEWKMGWDNVCDLMFNNEIDERKKFGTGIVAYHKECSNGDYSEVSYDDENQGWGSENFIKSKKDNPLNEHIVFDK